MGNGGLAMEDMSGYGEFLDIPEEVNRWNWGAFWLTWIWGYKNEVMIGFLGLIPIVNIFIMFYLGKNGNKIAWKNRHWPHLKDFENAQRKWALAGWIIAPFFIAFHLLIIYNYFYLENQEEYIRSETLKMINESEEAIRFIGGEVEITGYVRGSGFFFVDTTYSALVDAKYGKYWAAIRLDDQGKVREILLSHRFLIQGFKEVIITRE